MVWLRFPFGFPLTHTPRKTYQQKGRAWVKLNHRFESLFPIRFGVTLFWKTTLIWLWVKTNGTILG